MNLKFFKKNVKLILNIIIYLYLLFKYLKINLFHKNILIKKKFFI
jgi:hypothetical protein